MLDALHTLLAGRGWSAKDFIIRASGGEIKVNPWDHLTIEAVRTKLNTLWKCDTSVGSDRPQLLQACMVERALEIAEDPDSYFVNWIATGSVWLGVGKRMPRTPARYERKTAWRLDFKEKGEIARHGRQLRLGARAS
jgi:hypothetical protein